jgi:hypothetical protein
MLGRKELNYLKLDFLEIDESNGLNGRKAIIKV